MQKIKNAAGRFKKGLILLVLGVMATGLVAVTTVQPAMAVTCPQDSLRSGRTAKTLAECNVEESSNTLMPTILNIIKVVLGVLGLVAVVMIILGGVQYTTSAGDMVKVTKAKNTILFAVVGLIISLLAFAIVNFVLDNIVNGKGVEQGQQEESSEQ